jgi:isocitrate dehydrogenase
MGNRIIVPTEGERISVHNGKLRVPDAVIIPFVEGDGSGGFGEPRSPDAAVEAYKGNRKLVWMKFTPEKSI